MRSKILNLRTVFSIIRAKINDAIDDNELAHIINHLENIAGSLGQKDVNEAQIFNEFILEISFHLKELTPDFYQSEKKIESQIKLVLDQDGQAPIRSSLQGTLLQIIRFD